MTSNYKRLGDYIVDCNEKNNGNVIKELQGISNQKYFQKAKTNTIGIDLSKYRIVRTGQFAFNRATTRNGDKISIGLRQKEDCIVSPSYRIFKSKDENILNSEYLIMWFRRPEFDRYARFKSHGSAHEFFDYNEMCEVELPVPNIEKQQKIVKEYNTVVNRIKLNEQLNEKLEETAQALYKHWFVDFEFPFVTSSGVEMPYKSSGGKMVFNEELGKEIPEGWETFRLETLCKCNSSNYGKTYDFKEIHYLDTSNLTENKIEEIKILKVGIDTIPSRAKRLVAHNDIIYSTVRPNLRHYGIIKYPKNNMVVSTGFAVLNITSKEFAPELIYQTLIQEDLIKSLHTKAEMSVSTYPSIKPEDLLEINIVLPKENKVYLDKMNQLLSSIYELTHNNNLEVSKLTELKNVVLAKMTKVEVEEEIISLKIIHNYENRK